MNNNELNDLKKRYVANGAASGDSHFADHAENAELWDVEGKRFIDFAGGIGVLNIGHRHPKVVEAVKAQLDKVMHTCQTVMPYEGYVKVAEKLSQITPVRGHAKVMLANSGAEALENAVKVARAATGRSGVVCFTGGYHGRTFMTMAMNGKVAPYRTDFGPMPGQVYRAPYPVESIGVSEEDALRGLKMTFKTDANPKDTAAIVIEPVLGEGGFHAASPSFMKALREICDEHGILLIVDEVQSGFGRTGKMFAIEHTGVEPDIMTMAKSMAGGMPISAVVGTDRIMDASGGNSLGGTYTGSPVSCAAVLAVLDVFEEENILEKSRALGEKLGERFQKLEGAFDCVRHSRHLGAMAAFDLVRADGEPDAELAGKLCKTARERGLILLSCGIYANTIRFLMPVTISDEVLHEGMDLIETMLGELTQQ
ncbi:4-aminobutyrate transaminase [Kushneria pakistanensis]|uniref:4-aminobutyrate transaminase n=1 Tax=Kushneria pakistanensis TaxID=1508770 RepID=A0ABQ3FFU1_9GAMM|nr:4-aminobutyrate--2-oxoglutarate transaminase [Kushneria pakistanensis]GHC22194.1 4-aminobutyrate transaminase [Kushneria pakistanensis]